MSGQRKHNVISVGLIVLSIFINILLSLLIQKYELPLFLDTCGTIISACLGGFLPGIMVALFTNLLKSFFVVDSAYYGLVHILIAVITTFFAKCGFFKKKIVYLYYTLILAFIGGVIGGVLTYYFNGFYDGSMYSPVILFFTNECNLDIILSLFLASFLIDLLDKAVSVIIMIIAIKIIPDRLKGYFKITGWAQSQLDESDIKSIRKIKLRKYSMNTEISMLIFFTVLIVTFVISDISIYLFINHEEERYSVVGTKDAQFVASCVDGDKVDEYIEQGYNSSDYKKTSELLKYYRNGSFDVKYCYVYKLTDEGFIVVFDVLTDDYIIDEPGTVLPFDKDIKPYLSKLKEGKNIKPIITKNSNGKFMNCYEPVLNSSGECVCYAVVVIDMEYIGVYERDFILRLIMLFLGFFAASIALAMWIAKYRFIYPINSIANRLGDFSYNDTDALKENVKKIRQLDIKTGDEIENLYDSVVTMTEQSDIYYDEILRKTKVIEESQNGLIMVLADIVENRDESTGTHIKKTAAYVKTIMRAMRARGYHSQELTDEYIAKVVRSAPLHDIGKIKIPDAILNKPGKLTDEEYAIMKTHTIEGMKIIEAAISKLPEADYLLEAKELAEYHHEKWNGEGYPHGIKGEEIPLSARVMAIADVFDALVSKRCYKEAYSFEEAVDIIKKERGEHFDPDIVDAFFFVEEEIRNISKMFGEQNI